MEPKRTKYDTNPLDPEVARNTEKVWGESEDQRATANVKGATTRVGPTPENDPRKNLYSEAPTRTFDSTPPADGSYPSVFVPPTYAPPAEVYQPRESLHRPASLPHAGSRNVEGLGIPEKWATVLPYAPLYIGVVASILELILVPRNEVRVRAHAAQGLALQLAIVAINLLFGAIGSITGSSAGGTIFWLASNLFLIISMIRVGQGATHRIAPLKEPADWFNKRIDPRK
jgi:hypothetical protein